MLYEKLTVDTENTTEDRSSRSSSSPFSARAAFQQTQQILTSTKDTTKAVLSTVTDAKWWQGTLNKLKLPATKRQLSQDYNDRNKKMELQSCHPFYDGIIEHCYSDVVSVPLHHQSLSYWILLPLTQFAGVRNIRIYYECEGRIEKSVPRITVWHLGACRMMTNGDPKGQIFLSYPHTNNGFLAYPLRVRCISPIFFEVGIPNLICECILGGGAECQVPFLGHYDLDLWPSF